MKNTLKNRMLALPLLGYSLRIMSNIAHAPTYHDKTTQYLEQLAQEITNTNTLLTETTKQLSDTQDKLKILVKSRDRLQQQFMLLERNLGTKNKNTKTTEKSSASSKDDLFANDHLLDVFYTNFEDRFRGSEKMIAERLEEYLPDFKNAKVNFKKYPVLDIGTGRGEFLQLLKDNKINAQGLDINIDMVERSKKKGLKAVQGDALEYLQSSNSQSFGAITGFHIVEHIPFNILLRLFTAAHQALAEDGFVLFETPNPENIIVGSCAFYMDPSHLHPIPPDLLAFALETSGFRNVEIRRIHPVTEYDKGNLPDEFINRFYGPRDYVVLGYK